jgi:hypothetical protein
MDEIKEKNRFGQLLQAKCMCRKELSLGKTRQSVTPTMFLQGAIFLGKKRTTS